MNGIATSEAISKPLSFYQRGLKICGSIGVDKYTMFTPAYKKLHESGELQNRIAQAYELLRECRVCPRECGVNRLEGEVGVCGLGKDVMVSSFSPHFGEDGVDTFNNR